MARFGVFRVSGSVTLLCVALSVALSGCKNQAPPAAETTATAPAVSAPAAAAEGAAAPPATPDSAAPGYIAAAPAGPAASKYNEANFDLTLSPKGAYAPGQAAEAEIVLVAKAPFHVNQNYPYKFKLRDAPGLKFANPVVGKDAVKLEPARATMPVAFTPESAGKHTLAGQMSFSVCTDDKCMVEKRELSLDIDAK